MTLDEIKCGEGEQLEFKRALSKDDSKWLKTVVAFANGRGGRRQFESPIQEQVEKATQYVLEKINMGARFNGVYREDVYEIPPDAIRELIVNAVVHRSYLDGEASPITVALYDDRLEVTSPGGLVRGMTLEKMVNGYSDCRNKAVAAASPI